ncbi:MAG: hypothetical protein QOG85_655 [Gaiellaceae bacterium]|nr:hypothetical protein [Gaiellaceae bacterium]
MTKLRFYSVLLIAAFGAYVLLAATLFDPSGMNDGGGF